MALPLASSVGGWVAAETEAASSSLSCSSIATNRLSSASCTSSARCAARCASAAVSQWSCASDSAEASSRTRMSHQTSHGGAEGRRATGGDAAHAPALTFVCASCNRGGGASRRTWRCCWSWRQAATSLGSERPVATSMACGSSRAAFGGGPCTYKAAGRLAGVAVAAGPALNVRHTGNDASGETCHPAPAFGAGAAF
eukprot:scaffold16402_cov118-Isochrysis_galbana.AAC.3